VSLPQPNAPNPYAPPQSASGPFPAAPPGYYASPPPRVQGKLVTIGKMYALPALCVKCATPGPLQGRVQTFAWFPSWTYAFLFLGLLPMIIVQAIVTKRATLNLPLCPTCNSRWSSARLVRTLTIVGTVVGGLGLATVGAVEDWLPVMGVGFLLVFPGILALIPVDLLLVRPRTLRPTFIDDHVVTLDGVAPQMLEVLQRAEQGARP
jgi:hypothetical protein